ncbi:nucleotide sugar dehydrogenase [Nocardiopsis tropica]|jgi:UDP-N-acetyl-D-mannosaminuronic acid dehydrogenase|uniref:Nucleotide sugar dehydrogenase n=1 Tax=Nocardiopsis tropica TaxID=109330 RepID=A0ABU7KU41_9ACTN|nr:nucleotide sugar dehydrogenase [Nocardiopsis umidischolae]MEE2052810.1 nucleotide sugar dehydrogenase [Nocardiopsis umidischolae]
MRFLLDREEITVSVVGLGYVGSCVAVSLADNGVDVVGIDVDASLVEEMDAGRCRLKEPGLPELVARVRETGRLRVTTDYAPVSEADVVVVAVGTPVQENGALVETQVRSAATEIGRHLRPGQLVIFKSTVPPGTTRDMVAPLLEGGGLTCGEDFGLAFCPERLSQGNALAEIRRLPVVVGGWDARTGAAAERFWRSRLGVETVSCSSIEAAETVKLLNNWWIDHNIALANELARYCSAIGVDAMEVIAATNEVPKGRGSINVLSPGVGVGGSCLTKDPWMLWRSARERGVHLSTVVAAREANDAMPGYVAELVTDGLAALGTSADRSRVAVLGLSFKNNTGDLRATPTLPVVSALREAGAEVAVFDPLADPDEIRKEFGLEPSAGVEEAVAGAHCLAVLAWHDEFAELDMAGLRALTAPECLFLDGRAHFDDQTIESLTGLGFTYRGIGR